METANQTHIYEASLRLGQIEYVFIRAGSLSYLCSKRLIKGLALTASGGYRGVTPAFGYRGPRVHGVRHQQKKKKKSARAFFLEKSLAVLARPRSSVDYAVDDPGQSFHLPCSFFVCRLSPIFPLFFFLIINISSLFSASRQSDGLS